MCSHLFIGFSICMLYVFQFDFNCIQRTVDETHKIDGDIGDDDDDNDE